MKIIIKSTTNNFTIKNKKAIEMATENWVNTLTLNKQIEVSKIFFVENIEQYSNWFLKRYKNVCSENKTLLKTNDSVILSIKLIEEAFIHGNFVPIDTALFNVL